MSLSLGLGGSHVSNVQVEPSPGAKKRGCAEFQGREVGVSCRQRIESQAPEIETRESTDELMQAEGIRRDGCIAQSHAAGAGADRGMAQAFCAPGHLNKSVLCSAFSAGHPSAASSASGRTARRPTPPKDDRSERYLGTDQPPVASEADVAAYPAKEGEVGRDVPGLEAGSTGLVGSGGPTRTGCVEWAQAPPEFSCGHKERDHEPCTAEEATAAVRSGFRKWEAVRADVHALYKPVAPNETRWRRASAHYQQIFARETEKNNPQARVTAYNDTLKTRNFPLPKTNYFGAIPGIEPGFKFINKAHAAVRGNHTPFVCPPIG